MNDLVLRRIREDVDDDEDLGHRPEQLPERQIAETE